VLARSVRYRAPAGRRFDAAATAALLSAGDPASVVFAVGVGDGRVLVGATPELLASVRGRRVATHALAGTAPASAPPGHLLASAKDRREHALVVEGIRAELRPLCAELRVADTPRVRTLRRMRHLETPIEGRLREGVGLGDVVAALHPTPALGGRPRESAMAWLRAHEPLDRGPFGAPLGYELPNGDGDVVVAIRCLLVDGAWATGYAGAGIVAESDPDAEWAETELKLASVAESLAFEPAATADRRGAHG